MKKNIFTGFIVTTLMLLFCTSGAFAKELRMLSAYHKNFIFTKGIAIPFMNNLEEISGGNITVRFNGPDVIPTFEQFQPVQAGVFDLLVTHMSYHAGTIGLGVAIDATTADPTKRREPGGVFDFLDKEYNKVGMKVIAFPPLAPYQFVLKNALTGKSPSFDGLKLRSNPSIQNTIKSLGGAPVTMAGGEVYTALQKGVIDGAPWTTVGVKDFKWNEVADYLVRPTFASLSLMVAMNLDKYNALSAKEKAWLHEAAKKTEFDSIAYYKALGDTEITALKKGGMKETWLSKDDAANVEKYWNDGVWAMAIDKSGKVAKDFKKLAIAQGLTK